MFHSPFVARKVRGYRDTCEFSSSRLTTFSIEDPTEFLHPHQNYLVHQREWHSDTRSFASALRAVLRQAPKVILVGEMRDRDNVEIAMEAAENGHLNAAYD